MDSGTGANVATRDWPRRVTIREVPRYACGRCGYTTAMRGDGRCMAEVGDEACDGEMRSAAPVRARAVECVRCGTPTINLFDRRGWCSDCLAGEVLA